ncbi:MAG: transglutaminase family protein [Phycisphaerales bacterium]|nr:transglutaminase family protein [Phycisphaerales bacterium]
MLLQIEHSLHFSYSDYIRESHMDIRVEPRTQSGQVLLDFSLVVGPSTRVTRHEDWLGNTVHWFSITDYHDRIEVLVRSLVETNPAMILPGLVNDPISQDPPGMEQWDFMQFVGPVIESEAMRSLHADLRIADLGSIGEVVQCIGEGLRSKFEYRPNVTDAHSTTDALLLGGGGVCQDFAHAALGLLRLSGIPARYVSGYLHVERDDETPSQSHAWIEYWSPSNGWQPYDPTHGLVPNEAYVTVGYGRSYDDVPPNRGICQGGARETLKAEVITSPGKRPDRRRIPDELFMDLPVFTEAPDRRSRTDLPGSDAASQQQQQQQQ